MLALGEVRVHAAVCGMKVGLRKERIADDAIRRPGGIAVRVNERHGGLVAAGFYG